MTAIELIRKHDPNNLGEFNNADYIEMFAYAKELEVELSHLRKAENLPISDVSDRSELLLAYSKWWDKKYSPQRKDFHRHKDIDAFLSQ